MSEKRYFILTKELYDSDRYKELRKKACQYYGEKYSNILETDTLKDVLIEPSPNIQSSCNGSLFLTGSIIITMSLCDSIFIDKDWESDDVCKICHMLAFSHGVDLIYES